MTPRQKFLRFKIDLALSRQFAMRQNIFKVHKQRPTVLRSEIGYAPIGIPFKRWK